MAAAARLLLLVVAAASLLAASPADARPCRTFLISLSSNPNPDAERPIPLTTTVIAVFRIRRLGPHHPHPHHLHSLPAAIQIRRPEPLPLPAAAASLQERAKDILVVVVGLLFGVGCGALTAASMYLVWSVLAGAAASSHYDDLYDGEELDEASDSESPKKAGYVTIPDAKAYGGKN